MGNRPRDDPEYYGVKYQFVQTGDVDKSNGFLTEFTQTLNEKGFSVSRLFPKDIIVITISATVGSTAITTFPVCFPDSLIGISSNEMNIQFLEYFLRTRKNYLNIIAPRVSQKNINYDILNPLCIPKPDLIEQEKIASIITLIHENIDYLESKKTNFGKLKKGLMQKLLSGEMRVKT